MVDEGVRGGVVRRYLLLVKLCLLMLMVFERENLARVLELWLDGLGQLLAQFNTPLVVGVGVPDHLDIIDT